MSYEPHLGWRGLSPSVVIFDEVHVMDESVLAGRGPSSPFPVDSVHEMLTEAAVAAVLQGGPCPHSRRQSYRREAFSETVLGCMDCGEVLQTVTDQAMANYDAAMLAVVIGDGFAGVVPPPGLMRWASPLSDPIADMARARQLVARVRRDEPPFDADPRGDMVRWSQASAGTAPFAGGPGTGVLGLRPQGFDEREYGVLQPPSEDGSWERGDTAYSSCLADIDELLK